jgi:hypothetical protein
MLQGVGGELIKKKVWGGGSQWYKTLLV